MLVRPIERADIARWAELRAELWPQESASELLEESPLLLVADPPLQVFVAEDAGEIVGFLELGLRSVAEGCRTSPVPYVEGWYVVPEHRRGGVGKALMRAAEEWSRREGYSELGSDTEATNALSRSVHAALGFDEVETLVVFRKPL